MCNWPDNNSYTWCSCVAIVVGNDVRLLMSLKSLCSRCFCVVASALTALFSRCPVAGTMERELSAAIPLMCFWLWSLPMWIVSVFRLRPKNAPKIEEKNRLFALLLPYCIAAGCSPCITCTITLAASVFGFGSVRSVLPFIVSYTSYFFSCLDGSRAIENVVHQRTNVRTIQPNPNRNIVPRRYGQHTNTYTIPHKRSARRYRYRIHMVGKYIDGVHVPFEFHETCKFVIVVVVVADVTLNLSWFGVN